MRKSRVLYANLVRAYTPHDLTGLLTTYLVLYDDVKGGKYIPIPHIAYDTRGATTTTTTTTSLFVIVYSY